MPERTQSSAGSSNFVRSFRRSGQNRNKADGLRLPKVEIYIETPDTAGDGGVSFACAVFSSAACGSSTTEMPSLLRSPNPKSSTTVGGVAHNAPPNPPPHSVGAGFSPPALYQRLNSHRKAATGRPASTPHAKLVPDTYRTMTEDAQHYQFYCIPNPPPAESAPRGMFPRQEHPEAGEKFGGYVFFGYFLGRQKVTPRRASPARSAEPRPARGRQREEGRNLGNPVVEK